VLQNSTRPGPKNGLRRFSLLAYCVFCLAAVEFQGAKAILGSKRPIRAIFDLFRVDFSRQQAQSTPGGVD
jgi:hypothetical protein